MIKADLPTTSPFKDVATKKNVSPITKISNQDINIKSAAKEEPSLRQSLHEQKTNLSRMRNHIAESIPELQTATVEAKLAKFRKIKSELQEGIAPIMKQL